MERTFKHCDRCSANLTNEQESIDEISIRIVTQLIGKESMKDVLLCGFCYNQLISFFGKHNPFTGLDFIKANLN